MVDIFDRLSNWLVRTALTDATLEELIEQLCQRLIDGGVPVSRISIGWRLMHPVLALLDVTWDASDGRAVWNSLRRSEVSENTHRHGPFGEVGVLGDEVVAQLRHLRGIEMADMPVDYACLRENLTLPETRQKYPLYERLAAAGATDYLVYTVPFGNRAVSLGTAFEYTISGTVAFSTKRRSGFSDREVEGFRRILVPFMAALRATMDRYFVSELTETYLGRISAQSVLKGQIGRGDVRRIDCALLFSDMRDSTLLSQKLPAEDYLATVNRYFDCVAGAVLDHGGEVLKFMGDGLMAIFPFDNRRRLPEDMCAAALSAAREAFHRCSELPAVDRVEFGVALHVGEAVYGNVGTDRRLDFTVTGPSVAKVCRVEGMSRTLGAPLLATSDFAAMIPERADDHGDHALRGFDDAVEILSYPIRA